VSNLIFTIKTRFLLPFPLILIAVKIKPVCTFAKVGWRAKGRSMPIAVHHVWPSMLDSVLWYRYTARSDLFGFKSTENRLSSATPGLIQRPLDDSRISIEMGKN